MVAHKKKQRGFICLFIQNLGTWQKPCGHIAFCLLPMQSHSHEFVARNGGRVLSLDSRNITYVFSVPEVISSVTKITLFLSLFGSLVSHESWNFTIFGCCNCFSISASSLNLARSAFEYLSFKKENIPSKFYYFPEAQWRRMQIHSE